MPAEETGYLRFMQAEHSTNRKLLPNEKENQCKVAEKLQLNEAGMEQVV